MLTPLQMIFYVFGAVAVISAVFVITTRNPVRSVLSLVVTFFAMSGIWMMLRAEFLSLILLLVYVGAVMTLFLFVVMMLSINRETKAGGFIKYLPLGIIMMLLMTGILIVAIAPQFGFTQLPAPQLEAANYNNLTVLGSALYTQYVYPFEIAGVVLLVAIVAAITLTHRGPVARKVQVISKQVDIDPSKRVTLVDLRAKPEGGDK